MQATVTNLTSLQRSLPFPFHKTLPPNGVVVEDVSPAAVDSFFGRTFRAILNAQPPVISLVWTPNPLTSLSGQTEAADGSGLVVALRGAFRARRLNLASVPTNGDTVTIGGITFQFVTALGAQTANTQVLIGTAAQSRTWLINAINWVPDTHVVPGSTFPITLVAADLIDTSRVRVRDAVTQGGTPVVRAKAFSSVAVSASLTAAPTDGWDSANLNEQGRLAVGAMDAGDAIAVTAAMIAAGKVYFQFDFAPTQFIVQARTAAGLIRQTITDGAVIEGNAVRVNLAGGAAPAIQATDIVTVSAWT